MSLHARAKPARAVAAAAGLTLIAGAALAWIGFRALADRERAVETHYTSTTVLVRDRLVAEIGRLESELRGDLARAAAAMADRAAARGWLSRLTRERPWIAEPVLFDSAGRVLTPDLDAGWRPVAAPELQDRARFAALIREAESAEFAEDLPRALARYGAAEKDAASTASRALAQMRIGRVLFKLRQYPAGLERYRAVLESAGDLTDANGIPYAVGALRQMSAGFAVLQRQSERKDADRRLREYVVRRPWDVANGYEYHLALVHESPDTPDPSLALRIRQLRQGLDRIAWIRRELVPQVTAGADRARTVAATAGDRALVRWAVARLEEGVPIGLAYELRPSHLAGPLLDDVLRTVDLGNDLSIAVFDSADGRGGSLTFADLDSLPGWRVGLFHRRGRSIPQLVARERVIYGTFIGGMILVLLAGIAFTARASTREAQLARLRTDFVASVSHELKTPLALIRMYGETLDDGLATTESQRREFYGVIRRESERLTHLIDNVLDMARIDAGTKQYSLQEVEMSAIVRAAVETYRPFFERQAFDVQLALPADAVPVRADRDAVVQALINLFNNAVKYSADVKRVAVSLEARESEVRLSVADHGIGIAAEEIPRIFGRYYRAPNAGRGATAGSGLGLTLVAHAMSAHGGRVDVESTPDAGSVFTLVFPARPQHGEGTQP